MSGTSGSSGFGSVNIEQMDKSTEQCRAKKGMRTLDRCPGNREKNKVPLEMVSAGDHWSLKMSRQIDPLALMLG